MKRSAKVAAALAVVAASAWACAGSTSSDNAFDGGGAGNGGAQSGGSAGIGGKAGTGGTGAVAGVGGNSGSGGSGVGGNGGSGVGGNGGSGGSGVGGADAGGGCTDPDGLDPNVAGITSGLNGSYADECDASGNLVEYVCEVIWQENCFPNPDPSCRRETGRAVPTAIDCAGRCQNGMCSGRCPDFGETLTYLEVDPSTGRAVLRNEVDGRRYSCSVIFDSSSDSYDCKTDPAVGVTTTIESLGISSQFCLGTELGNIGTAHAGVQQCTYSCTMLL